MPTARGHLDVWNVRVFAAQSPTLGWFGLFNEQEEGEKHDVTWCRHLSANTTAMNDSQQFVTDSHTVH